MMGSVMVESFLRRLGEEQARRILRIAIREQSAVLLESGRDLSSNDQAGYILGGDDDSLTVILSQREGLASDTKTSEKELDCRIFLGEETYFFTTRIVEVDRVGPSPAVRIALPKTVFVEGRRQCQRARFAESSSVEIAGKDHGVPWVAKGKLCNVGADGIAVLVAREAADRMSEEESLTVSFQLPGCASAFALSAFVRGKTPASAPDRVILRTQFVRGCTAEMEKHLDVLSGYLDDHFSRGKRGE